METIERITKDIRAITGPADERVELQVEARCWCGERARTPRRLPPKAR